MLRLKATVTGLLVAALTCAPMLAHAQYEPPPPPAPPPPPQYPPPPPPPQYYAPPPPQYYAPPPPPPQYYAPPPPQYYAPPGVVARPPSNGLGALITGSIFLPLGIILLGTSVVLWDDAGVQCPNAGTVNTFNCNNQYNADVAGGVVMDIFGSAMVVMGAILIPVGIVQMAKYKRWSQGRRAGLFDLGHGVSVTPSVSASHSVGSASLKFSF